MSVQQIALVVLVGALVACSAIDLIRHRIPNFITLPLAAAALGAHTVASGLPGLGQAAAGLAAGLIGFLPFYLLGAMGAGDVKLMTGVGGWLGFSQTLWALAFSLIAGGLLALCYMLASLLARRRTDAEPRSPMLLQLVVMAESRSGVMQQKFPYAVAIAAGTLLALARADWRLVPVGH